MWHYHQSNMEKSTTRLEAFSDGIFGVAITLLGIEIGIANMQILQMQTYGKR